jgi:alcohol dehydrogenase (cytochrome c)
VPLFAAAVVLGIAAVLPAGAQAPAPVPQSEASPGAQWLSYNNRLDGQRFSPLKEITPANVKRLGEVCRVQVDGPTSFHSGLVVVDGTIFTSTGRETVAIDAATCALRWRHSYVPDEERATPSTRGLAVDNGRVFRGTADGRLLALDATTGRELWKSVIAAPRLGESTAAAPLAWAGVVYMGIAGSDLGARGRVMAFDQQTGRELWRFHTIPMGSETGAETWERPGTAKTGGGGIWGAMTLDVATGELFVPVGNPWPDIDRAYRPGKNLFTNAVVVLDARSGALRWWYQATPEDWVDLDLAAPPVLYRARGARDLVVFGGKDGHVWAVDRDTHEQVFRTPVTTIDNPHPGPTREGTRVCPGFAGGIEWNGPALDTLTGQLVTGAVDQCFILKLGRTEYSPDESNYGGSVEPVGPATGWVTAIDSETGAVRWRYHAEKPVIAGVTPTAGGITFAGDLAGNLLAFDSRSGTLLHKAQTGGALAGGLVTYEIRGRQYVAFASGNVSRNAFGALGVPSVVVMAIDAPLLKAAATPGSGASVATAPGTMRRSAGSAAAPDRANGRRLYGQVCVACHGPDGNLVSDHRLANLKGRQAIAATVASIREPKAPMPKLYPELLDEQAVLDVATFLHEDLR